MSNFNIEKIHDTIWVFHNAEENITMINNIPKFIGFEEYYNKLENGEI